MDSILKKQINLLGNNTKLIYIFKVIICYLSKLCSSFIPFLAFIYFVNYKISISFVLIILTISFNFVLKIVYLYLNYLFNAKMINIRENECTNFLYLLYEIDYEILTSNSFLDDFYYFYSFINSNNGKFEQFYSSLENLIVSIFSILFFVIVIIIILPKFIFMFIFTLLIIVLIEYYFKDKSSIIDRRMSAIERKFVYFDDVMINTNTAAVAKSMNVYKSFSKIIQHEEEKLNHYFFRYFNNFLINKSIKSILSFVLGIMLLKYMSYLYKDNLWGNVAVGICLLLNFNDYIDLIIESMSEFINIVKSLREYYIFKENKILRKRNISISLENNNINNIVSFKEVAFKYNDGVNMLFSNVSFQINCGEKIAIVGNNGSGKTTLINLLIGNLYPTLGEISYNKNLCFDFSVYFQNSELYTLKLIDNILEKNDDRLIKQMNIYAKKIDIYDYLEKQTNFIADYISPYFNNENFSYGQKTKLLILRALCRNSNLLVLDEPGASLDALSEAELYHLLTQKFSDNTIVFITHKLSCVSFCDKIIYLDNGNVYIGTHDELIKNVISYEVLFKKQERMIKFNQL